MAAVPSKSNRQESAFASLRDATFRLGDRLIFPNTTWTWRRDEQWAVLGDNGSGKSLLGEAIRGRLPLVGGELFYHFAGRQPAIAGRKGRHASTVEFLPEDLIGHVSFDERKHEVHGTVIQSRWNSLEDESSLSVTQYLSYERVMEINPYEVRKEGTGQRSSFERRKRRATLLLGIGRFGAQPLLSLSNGERQKVELARVLCRPLRLLILDEPFTGLDVRSRKEFGEILEQLMGTRLRVLLITTRAADLPRGITHVLEVGDCAVRCMRPAQLGLPLSSRSQAGKETRTKKPKRRETTRPTGSSHSSNRRLVLELRNVTVRYGNAVLLKGIDWQVREGESWALLGPNGSGKSTLLSLITGDNPQVFNNDISVLGRRLGTGTSVWELKRQIGYVSPELQLHFNEFANCLEVVTSGFAGTIGVFDPPAPRQIRAARRVLKELGVEGCADKPLFALSTGLQRMVLLVRALVSEPRLLLLDEPCQGLDSEHRHRFVQRIDKVVRSGETSVVYVTHRADELPVSIKKVFRLVERRKG